MSVPTGRTRVAAVIGSPVRHSLSPAIHNAAFAAAGLDWVYVAFEVAPGRAVDALDAMRTLGLGGLSVTMPHKEAVAAAVDRLDFAAAALAAVNTVVVDRDGALVGHNTDGAGFVDSLRADGGIEVHGRAVVVLGAGGAARAVVDALARAGADDVVVVNRTPARGEVAAALAGSVGRVGTGVDVSGADVVVNATSVGMAGVGAEAGLPVDPDLLRAGQVVVDLVYHPLDTPLLQAARAAGAVAVDGLGMLVHQAAHQQLLWTGRSPDVAAMRAAALAELRD
jgi:shikimate dehydrogenase